MSAKNKSKTKKTSISKTILVLIIAVIAIGAAFYIHATRPVSNPSSYTNPNQKTTASNPILLNVDSTLPSASWGPEQITNEQTIYGNLKGVEQINLVTSANPTYNHFEDPKYLAGLGYTRDKNLDAAGPGAQVWGYKKTQNNTDQVIIFSYTTAGNTQNPNAHIQFNCPCKMTIKAFVSNPFKNAQ